jgi:hypothetical protein
MTGASERSGEQREPSWRELARSFPRLASFPPAVEWRRASKSATAYAPSASRRGERRGRVPMAGPTMVHGVIAGRGKIRVSWADGATSLLGGKALALELDSDLPRAAAAAAVVHEALPVGEPEEAGSVADSCPDPDPSVASSAESDTDEEAGPSVHEPELGGAELLHAHDPEWTQREGVEDSHSSPNYATALLWPDGRGSDARPPWTIGESCSRRRLLSASWRGPMPRCRRASRR